MNKLKSSAVILMIAISFAFALFLSPVGAEKLCGEKLGPYYVNIGLKNDSFGAGLEDAFEIEIMKIRPKSFKLFKPFKLLKLAEPFF